MNECQGPHTHIQKNAEKTLIALWLFKSSWFKSMWFIVVEKNEPGKKDLLSQAGRFTHSTASQHTVHTHTYDLKRSLINLHFDYVRLLRSSSAVLTIHEDSLRQSAIGTRRSAFGRYIKFISTLEKIASLPFYCQIPPTTTTTYEVRAHRRNSSASGSEHDSSRTNWYGLWQRSLVPASALWLIQITQFDCKCRKINSHHGLRMNVSHPVPATKFLNYHKLSLIWDNYCLCVCVRPHSVARSLPRRIIIIIFGFICFCLFSIAINAIT